MIPRQFRIVSITTAVLISSSLSIGASSASADEGPQSLSATIDLTEGQFDLALPPIPYEMLQLQEQLYAKFGSSPSLGQAEISEDRSTFIVRWFGAQPQELRNLISGHDSDDFAVEVEPTAYSPAALQAEVESLLTRFGGQEGVLAGAGPSPDGSGIEVSIDPAASLARRGGGPDTLLNSLGVHSPFPLYVVATGGIEPSAGSRWYSNSPHYSGSVMSSNAGLSCSTSFRVSRTNGDQGMLTASHCGGIGDAWRQPYNSAVSFGATVQESNPQDAAIITGASYSRAIYTGAYNSSAVVSWSSYISSTVVGAEVCYSGGFSGWNCGSIVDNANFTWSYSTNPEIGTITGMRTWRTSPTTFSPAAGNGDSGGPGVQLYARDGNVYAAAFSIISGIQNAGSVCEGIPGGTAEGERKCSGSVLATNAATAASAMGWSMG